MGKELFNFSFAINCNCGFEFFWLDDKVSKVTSSTNLELVRIALAKFDAHNKSRMKTSCSIQLARQVLNLLRLDGEL